MTGVTELDRQRVTIMTILTIRVDVT